MCLHTYHNLPRYLPPYEVVFHQSTSYFCGEAWLASWELPRLGLSSVSSFFHHLLSGLQCFRCQNPATVVIVITSHFITTLPLPPASNRGTSIPPSHTTTSENVLLLLYRVPYPRLARGSSCQYHCEVPNRHSTIHGKRTMPTAT